jgi:hypothetical protein
MNHPHPMGGGGGDSFFHNGTNFKGNVQTFVKTHLLVVLTGKVLQEGSSYCGVEIETKPRAAMDLPPPPPRIEFHHFGQAAQ